MSPIQRPPQSAFGIYSNYKDTEKEKIKETANELGFSLSAFQKYCVMLYSGDKNNIIQMIAMKKEMLINLKNQSSSSPFIVSALLSDKWPSLSRSEKMQLAKFLASYVKHHSDKYSICSKVGTTTQYQKK